MNSGTLKTYETALSERDRLEVAANNAGAALSELTKGVECGPMGLTPDHIKATPEWKNARRLFDSAFQDVRLFNVPFIRTYKKQWRETLAARREARKHLNP